MLSKGVVGASDCSVGMWQGSAIIIRRRRGIAPTIEECLTKRGEAVSRHSEDADRVRQGAGLWRCSNSRFGALWSPNRGLFVCLPVYGTDRRCPHIVRDNIRRLGPEGVM